jgi:4-hydroxy-3-polyprenylbenzoate decarboxylase
MNKKRLVVAMTGASGSVLALELLKRLRGFPEWETHFVMSRGAALTASHELPGCDFSAVADTVYDNGDIGAAIASGSFRAAGMAVLPCSMKTVAGINGGYADNLILRAADVTLKEGRPLVLVPRETPLSPVHLRNLSELAMMGAAIIPPMMTFYNRPETIGDMVSHLIGKVLDRLGLPAEYKRWGE